MKLLKAMNVLSLLLFSMFYSLAFIFVGFTEHYLVLMIEAIFFPGLNLYYLNLTIPQKLKFLRYISCAVYGFALINFSICALYTFMAFIHTEDKEDPELQRVGKWMLTFIALYLWQIGSFLLNAKEFKHLYLDNRDIFDDDSSDDEENTNSDGDLEENEDDNISSDDDNEFNKNNEKMEVIYIS